MIEKMVCRLSMLICFVFLALATGVIASYGYDREHARDYGINYGVVADPLTGEEAHDPAYRWMPGDQDCANFASQCAIAGGIRFRSGNAWPINDNTWHPFGQDSKPELETGASTTWINSSNMKDYSRTVGFADHMPRSLKHRRHSFGLAKEYYTLSQLADSNGDLWDNLRPGDFVFQGGPGHYSHCMLISTVVKTSPYDLKICGHNHTRSDYPISAPDALGSNWKSAVSVVRIPDAPRLIGQEFWSGWGSGAKPVSYLWVIKRVDPGSGSIRIVGPQDLVIKLTYDCDMKIDATPDVHIRLNGSDFAAVPLTGDELNQHGWWTASNSGDFVQNRTWKGVIYGSETEGPLNKLPPDLNGVGRLWIHAQGRDGSWNDSDNGLSKYDSGTGMRLIGFNIDTRRSKTKRVN